MDKIFFRNFTIQASVGLLAHEKKQKQTLVIDLEFAIDASTVSTLADTTDYAAVRSAIIEIINADHYDLLECLAELICQQLLAKFNLSWVKLALQKPDIFADMDAVGVVIERHHTLSSTML